MKITSLGYALIGLLSREQNSGYALRRMFETTPLGAFSSSPGSIYPALDKLVKSKLVEKVPASATDKSSFRITELGREALLSWLSQEISIDEVEKNQTLIILRFSFLESANNPPLTLLFLQSFQRVLKEHLSNLRAFMSTADGKALSAYGRLSMQSGISQYETHLRWVGRAMDVFQTSVIEES